MKSLLICFCFMIYLEQAATDHSFHGERTSNVHLKLDSHETPELRTNLQVLEKKVIGCPDGCFQAGSECFMKLPNCTSSWDEALQQCAENGHSLAEPEDFEAVADYLKNNNMFQHCMFRGQESYFWLGAHTGPNNDTVQWVSGEEVAANAPWYNQQNYEECSKQPMCMALGNEAACERENVCIGCVDCFDVNLRNVGLNTLCECEPIFVSECSPECIHGECVGPNQCQCEPGWMGPLCDKQITWPYVGDKCCNLSTTTKCLRKGGECMPKNDTCIGEVFNGPRYCDFNNLKSCKCCVPAECKTLSPCAAMNGTCNTTCKGKSVSGKDFCKDHEFCKCCLPDDCPCGQDSNGGCSGQLISGNWTEGSCMKTCDVGTGPLYNHTCSQTGGEECNCCAPLSISCPYGCFQIGSECFKQFGRDAFPMFQDGLSWSDAYKVCVDNDLSLAEPENIPALSAYLANNYQGGEWWLAARSTQNVDVQWVSGGALGPDAPWGYSNEYQNCYQTNECVKMGIKPGCYEDNRCIWCQDCGLIFDGTHGEWPLCECEPIYGYTCTPKCIHGKCIGHNKCECKPGWTGTHCETPGECSDPDECECNPGTFGPRCDKRCPNDCFKSGSECFRVITNHSSWDEALQLCSQNGHFLAEPDNFLKLVDDLYIIQNGGYFWIGAHTGPNNDTVQWVSGGELGPEAPWVYRGSYNECSRQPMCNAYHPIKECYKQNRCLRCFNCEDDKPTLCECEPISV